MALPTEIAERETDAHDSGSEWMVIDAQEEPVPTEKPTPEAVPEPKVGGLDQDSELDLCFICDCTGSMGQYIKAAQDNIQSIVGKIGSHGAKVRFGLISYRDHPPQERTYVTQSHPFTEDVETMRGYVHTMKAHGGGDGPEAVTAALFEALSLPWRPNATKICVLIADAPPHGLESSGDGFPNGDPEGRDPLQILRDMAVHGITCYSVGCEPALGAYQFARDFLCNVAEMTGGQAIALSSAAMLADVIINGSAEELALAKLQRQVEEEVRKVQDEASSKGKDITTEDSVAAAVLNLHSRGMKSVQMATDGHMQNATKGFWGNVEEKKCLAEVKAELASRFPRSLAAASPIPTASATAYGGSRPMMARGIRGIPRSAAAPPAPCEAPMSAPVPTPAAASCNVLKTDLISTEQVSRIVQKAKCQSRLR